MSRMRRIRVWLAILVAMTFLSGVSLSVITVKLVARLHEPIERPEREYREEVASAVGLADGQFQEFLRLQEKYQARYNDLMDELEQTRRARLQTITEELERDFLELLTPEQRERYRRLSRGEGTEGGR